MLISFSFFSFSRPSLDRFGKQVYARTHIGKNLSPEKFADARIVDTVVYPELHLVDYLEGKVVSVYADGIQKSSISIADTVGDLLDELDIVLQKYDEINKAVQEPLEDQDFIRIYRIQYRDFSELVEIPYAVVHQSKPQVYQGLKVAWQPGEKGKKRKYYCERIEDGKIVSRNLVKEEILISPTTEIIAHGTLNFTGDYVKKIRMLASSYNPTVEQCGPNPFVTYSGLRVRYGIVATDPKVIPLGTWLYVSGYGYALAADIGGAIKGNRIDCFFWTSHVGSGWRGGYIDVYILDKEP